MNNCLYQGWIRTSIMPTSMSSLFHVGLFAALVLLKFPGGLKVIAVVFVSGVFGIPLTFIATNLAWFFIRDSSKDDQSRIGTALAFGTPALVLIATVVVTGLRL